MFEWKIRWSFAADGNYVGFILFSLLIFNIYDRRTSINSIAMCCLAQIDQKLETRKNEDDF